MSTELTQEEIAAQEAYNQAKYKVEILLKNNEPREVMAAFAGVTEEVLTQILSELE